MADTNFVAGTVIASNWLNDVNDAVYNYDATAAGATGSLQKKLKQIVSPRDAPWNAAGDGVTNDTAALTAFLLATAGMDCNFENGYTYLTTTQLSLQSGTRYRGKSKIKASNTAAITGSVLVATSKTGVSIEDLEIDGNAANNGVNYGITLDSGVRNSILNVYVHDTRAAGIRIISESQFSVIGGSLIDCGRATTVTGGASTDDHGLMAYSITATPLQYGRIKGLYVTGALTRKGITTYSDTPGTVKDILIEGNVVTGCALGGIYAGNAPTGIDQVGIDIVGNVTDANYVNIQMANVRGGSISGNTSRLSSGDSGVQLAGTTAVAVTGNLIDQSFADGIKLTTSCLATNISGNTISKSNRGAAGQAAVNILLASYTNVSGNTLIEDSAPATAYGVLEQGASDFNQVHGNITSDFLTSACLTVGANSYKQGIVGSKQGFGTTAPNAQIDVLGVTAVRNGVLTLANGLNSNVTLPVQGSTVATGPSAVFSIGGLAGGYDGRILTIWNHTAFVMTLKHQDAGSTAANQIICTGNADIAIAVESSVDLYYAAAQSRWVVKR